MEKFLARVGKRMAACTVLAAALAAVLAGGGELAADFTKQDSWHLFWSQAQPEGIWVETVGENLALHAGVRMMADSREEAAFSPEKCRDGVWDDTKSRWSSANDWENNEHWLEVCFPEEVAVGLVRIYWERTNACAYALEYAAGGEEWQVAARFEEPPAQKTQDIYLDTPVRAKRLRLHVTQVRKEEEDLSLYYQNVSVLELEVYEGIEDSFLIEKPVIAPGSRRVLPKLHIPQGYALEFVGADYGTVVDAKGRIADTLSLVEVELGYALVKDGVRRELPGMPVEIAAGCKAGQDGAGQERGTAAPAGYPLPEGFSAMEWRAGGHQVLLAEAYELILQKGREQELLPAARLFARELSAYLGKTVEIGGGEKDLMSGKADGDKGKIFLLLEGGEENGSDADWPSGLGQEGFEIWIGTQGQAGGGEVLGMRDQDVRILAETAQGIRWGCVSFLDLLEKSDGKLLVGILRDYPRYSVRGFGIDVGRRPVSLELLYRMVRELSRQKMNTLQIHLNDNQIIAQSEYDKTVEGARGLYAGFRLESRLGNENGEKITSADLFYTKEEFARFVEDAAAYGVEVVPEIDTPAHSLAITKVFPKLGLSRNPEGIDQLDVSNPEAVALVKALWEEYLTEDGQNGAAFGGCRAVHIGMDEYFGDDAAYVSYLQEISGYVSGLAPGKQIRVWGSLSGTEADWSSVSRSLQMHIWDTDWADPQEMYGAGFGIINSLSSSLYIIPGGGYDRLDMAFLQNSWQPNRFETAERIWELPAYSPRMLGSVYMMWNDWMWLNGETITEDALFDRFREPLPILAGKLWGAGG